MPLTKAEAEHISEITGRNLDDFTVIVNGYLQLANNPATRACVFLDTDSPEPYAAGTCSIYAHRPQGCQHYPFVIGDDEIIEGDEICPHVDEFDTPTPKQKKSLRILDQVIEREKNQRDDQ